MRLHCIPTRSQPSIEFPPTCGQSWALKCYSDQGARAGKAVMRRFLGNKVRCLWGLESPPTQEFLWPLDHTLDKQPLVTPSLNSSTVRNRGDMRSRVPPNPAAWNLLEGFAGNVPWAYYRKRQLLKDIRVREFILSNCKPSLLQSYFRD